MASIELLPAFHHSMNYHV